MLPFIFCRLNTFVNRNKTVEKKRIIKFITILTIFVIQFLFLFAIRNEQIKHYAVPYIIVAISLLLIIVYRKFPLHHNEFSFDKKNSIPFQKAVEASGKSKASYVRDAIETQLREDGFLPRRKNT